MAITGTFSASLIATFHVNPVDIGRVISMLLSCRTGDLGRGVGGGRQPYSTYLTRNIPSQEIPY